MRKALVIACVLAAGAASPVLAANANHPYQNCNRKIDNCGPTGNDITDQLNAQQLGNPGAPGGGGGVPMQGGGNAPMQGGSGMPPQGGSGMSR